MFCKNCGIRINETEERCPSCGTPASYSEYCGGFWGLVGKTPPAAPVRAAVPAPTAEAEQAAPVKKAKPAGKQAQVSSTDVAEKAAPAGKKSLPVALIAIFAVVLLAIAGLSGYQTYRISQLQGDVEYLFGKINQLKSTVDTLNETATTHNTQTAAEHQEIIDLLTVDDSEAAAEPEAEAVASAVEDDIENEADSTEDADAEEASVAEDTTEDASEDAEGLWGQDDSEATPANDFTPISPAYN